MKTGTLIVFQLERKKKRISMKEACKFYRKLYGYNNCSYYGKYHTRVPGLIDEIPAIRLGKSVLIVRNEDAPLVIALLEEYNAKYVVRKVVLEKEDYSKLNLS